MSALREAAPRGKQYAVAHLTHVTPDAALVIEKARHATLGDVAKQIAQVDWRLQPMVVVIDKETA